MSSFGSIIKVKNNDKYMFLLVKGKYAGKWSFPKGHIEKGETQLQCAIRETKEETGIDLNGIQPENKKIRYRRYFIFTLSSIPETKIIDTNEIEQIRWMTIEEMQNIHGNGDVKFFIKKYLGLKDVIKGKADEIVKQPEIQPIKQPEKIYCSWANMIKGKADEIVKQPEIQPIKQPEKIYCSWANMIKGKTDEIVKQPEIQPIKQPEKIYCSWANMIKGKADEIEKQPEIQPDPEKEFLDYYNETASKHQYYQDRDLQLWYIIKMAY